MLSDILEEHKKAILAVVGTVGAVVTATLAVVHYFPSNEAIAQVNQRVEKLEVKNEVIQKNIDKTLKNQSDSTISFLIFQKEYYNDKVQALQSERRRIESVKLPPPGTRSINEIDREIKRMDRMIEQLDISISERLENKKE